MCSGVSGGGCGVRPRQHGQERADGAVDPDRGPTGSPPHMKLVDALSGSVRESGGVCVGEDRGNRQMLSPGGASAN